MELAKTALYMGNEMAANIIFGVFALTFIGTRCFLYPTVVIRSVAEYGYKTLPDKVYYAVMVLLCSLQVLHVFWSYLVSSSSSFFVARLRHQYPLPVNPRKLTT